MGFPFQLRIPFPRSSLMSQSVGATVEYKAELCGIKAEVMIFRPILPLMVICLVSPESYI